MNNAQQPINALPNGYRLQEYELVRVLGFGGFGMTYLGYDHNLDKPVAIKEYLPSDIAIRTGDYSVVPQASEFQSDFAWGLDRFMDEARTLARFDHRHLVKVYRFFEAHNTAYIVMEYAEGETLSAYLNRKGILTEDELKAILHPILDGLEAVHRADFLHRDIKPGNIVIRDADHSPVLIDFGAARQAVGAKSRSVTSIVTPGYAPIEQYESRGNQGPWTDIYALGGVCYRALTDDVPVPAMDRARRDPLVPVSERCKGHASHPFLAAIDHALQVDETARPQSVSEWRAELGDAPVVARRIHHRQRPQIKWRAELADALVVTPSVDDPPRVPEPEISPPPNAPRPAPVRSQKSDKGLRTMFGFVKRYAHWLHTRWPSGTVEKLPEMNADGSTAVPGLYIAGDLTGIPLLKFSSDTGARAVRTIANDAGFERRAQRDGVRDLAIIGGGVSGMAAALEAKKRGLDFALLESSERFSTVVNFPKGKPIYTYPTDMLPAGDLQFSDRADVKERLLEELEARTADIEPVIARAECVRREGEVLRVVVPDGEDLLAHRVVVAIGRSGNFRKLNVPGEDRDKVVNRLHDPKDYADRDVLVVGGGDSALETAIAIAECGGRVTLSYRRAEFSRPKPENKEKIESLPDARLALGTEVARIGEGDVTLSTGAGDETLPNDAVFAMIGREAPLDFFRRSGVPIRGEWRARTWASFALIMLACAFVYHWKTEAGIPIYEWFKNAELFPFNLAPADDKSGFFGTVWTSMTQPGFYYSLAYCACVVGFGIRRIGRRQTPYVTVQTLTLMLIQCIPLFLLPYILLPWMGHNGYFSDGAVLKPLADALFPATEWDPHGREYWRSLGFVLAWPLFFWNVFTSEPLGWWLGISLVQTFVIIPLLIWRWGKGAYCGWICSCGALAETMGDTHRQKMPHGPLWNRMNMVGQAILVLAFAILALRIAGWVWPDAHWMQAGYMGLFMGRDAHWAGLGFPLAFLNYQWFVDLFLAGIIGVGFYWHFSGRMWCRFACPLAALMHLYARFSRFRIFADKKKCISCNVCTSVCHQGIDVMNFANKGLPMEDPQCVRCSACVQSCPTGVLTFGQIDPATGHIAHKDGLPASRVHLAEGVESNAK